MSGNTLTDLSALVFSIPGYSASTSTNAILDAYETSTTEVSYFLGVYEGANEFFFIRILESSSSYSKSEF